MNANEREIGGRNPDILVIECSTRVGSVAVAGRGGVSYHATFSAERGRCGGLFEVLQAAPMDGVGEVVTGLGPGSYAGVRVALAAALGLSVARGWARSGVVSVAGYEAEEYLAVGDARRQAFLFARVRDGRCVEGPLLATAVELNEHIARSGPLPIFGPSEITGVPELRVACPDAARLAELLLTGKAERRVGDEPIYLREPHITVAKR